LRGVATRPRLFSRCKKTKTVRGVAIQAREFNQNVVEMSLSPVVRIWLLRTVEDPRRAVWATAPTNLRWGPVEWRPFHV